MEMDQGYRDRIATVNEKGKRVWVFPKMPKGKFYNYRKLTSYILLVFLFMAPHIKVNGKQLLLFNILDRKFIIFGKVFWPQDLWIFALVLVLGVVFIIFFTIVFGRLFCGWVCPQTIFMEMVFRRIEYWIDGDMTSQKKLAADPWTGVKIRKRVLKHFIFWCISFLIANTFLAYIIGSDQLWAIQSSPIDNHLGGFIAIIIFTTVFYLVFAQLREQVCTTICPYGRLQGVLLDNNSLVVAYDYKRGEPRGKFRKNEEREDTGKGDCIDCNQCVHVCPTGIDIRHGTQLECVNCTACIDACDHMMESVGLPKKLIGFLSENGIKEGQKFQWTGRVKSYTLLLIILLGLVVTALITRKDFETVVLRQRGTTYKVTNGMVVNIFEINLTNKTSNEYKITLKLPNGINGEVEQVVKNLKLGGEARVSDRFIVRVPLDKVKNGKETLTLEVYGNGKLIDEQRIKVIGPMY